MSLFRDFVTLYNNDQVNAYIIDHIQPRLISFLKTHPLPSHIDLTAFDLVEFMLSVATSSSCTFVYRLFIVLICVYIDPGELVFDLFVDDSIPEPFVQAYTDKVHQFKMEVKRLMEAWLEGKSCKILPLPYTNIQPRFVIVGDDDDEDEEEDEYGYKIDKRDMNITTATVHLMNYWYI